MHGFSEELIKECIKYFEENKITLTEEEARNPLSGLGGLYLAFSNDGERYERR